MGYLIVEEIQGEFEITKGCVTRFAWDLARQLSERLVFQGEIVLNWEEYGSGYDHSYCLIFRVD